MLAKTKMKLSATGDRGVPEESRFYLSVVMDTPNDAPPNLSSSSSDSSGSGGGPMPSKALFFSGRVSVGKVLDRCAEAFGVDVRPSGNEGEDFSFNRLYNVVAQCSTSSLCVPRQFPDWIVTTLAHDALLALH